jgi:hypothetical protein
MYRIIAIPQDVATAVRATQTSPFGAHPAHIDVATGHGPCRLCLRDFAVGKDRRILFTYDQFAGRETLPLPGPVFIHEAECTRYPEDGGFPSELWSHPLTLVAYGVGRRFIDQEYVAGAEQAAVIDRLFARPEVSYIQVCNTEAGCYDLRIERAGGFPRDNADQ